MGKDLPNNPREFLYTRTQLGHPCGRVPITFWLHAFSWGHPWRVILHPHLRTSIPRHMFAYKLCKEVLWYWPDFRGTPWGSVYIFVMGTHEEVYWLHPQCRGYGIPNMVQGMAGIRRKFSKHMKIVAWSILQIWPLSDRQHTWNGTECTFSSQHREANIYRLHRPDVSVCQLLPVLIATHPVATHTACHAYQLYSILNDVLLMPSLHHNMYTYKQI